MISTIDALTGDRRISYLALFLLALSAAGALWWGYGLYRASVERVAYKDLAETIDTFNKLSMTGESGAKLKDVERAFAVGAERHQRTALYPEFLLYQSEVLSQMGKGPEALAILASALTHMKKDSPLFYLYSIKQALLKIDSGDASLQKEGRQALAALADDKHNILQDMARYYAGLDALNIKDTQKAKKYFQEITSETKEPSQWSRLAAEKASQL